MKPPNDDGEATENIEDAVKITTSGRWEAVNKRIELLAAVSVNADQVWHFQLFSTLWNEVATEYLYLINQRNKRNLAHTALSARNLLELSVWVHYCAKDTSKARTFYDDATWDAKDLIKTFAQWEEEPGATETAHQQLAQHATAAGVNLTPRSFTRVAEAAKETDLRATYATYSKLLSKLAHPTAWRVQLHDEAVAAYEPECFRLACLFFCGTFDMLEFVFSHRL